MAHTWPIMGSLMPATAAAVVEQTVLLCVCELAVTTFFFALINFANSTNALIGTEGQRGREA